uniref:GRIP domain-containing protein n=1 Tax=Caenorhabditis tropicalis TaxID=1561998 RepID=A0A1I7UFQ3_9PELO
MKTEEEIQTEMMMEMFRSKDKEVKKLRSVLKEKEEKIEKTIPPRDPSETLLLISMMLTKNNDDRELIKSMDLLIPIIIGVRLTPPT